MILQGHVLDVLAGLEAESVQCVVTSPPFWALRDYKVPPSVWGGDSECVHQWSEHRQYKDSPTRSGAEGLGSHDAATTRQQRWQTSAFCACGAWRGQLGLEPTPEDYAEHMVDVFAAIRRVLRKDGVLWLNLGDTYATGAGQGYVPGGGGQGARWLRTHDHWQPNRLTLPGLKKGDRVGIPHRVVFALQAAGWWWRDEVVWQKPNPMPSSAGNRTTPSHEMLFMLTKSARYFSDFVAIAEDGHGRRHAGFNERYFSAPPPTTRNRRSVWSIPTQPFPEAHFATFPEALVSPCILAGTSEWGRCADCGAPWARITETEYENPGNRSTNGPRSLANRDTTPGFAKRLERRSWTTGWVATCKHAAASRLPCLVLDPFAGSGTVGVVAKSLGREFVGIELNPDYCAIAERRIAAQNPALPLEFTA